MNARITIAQAGSSTSTGANAGPPRVIKVVKPAADQAITLELGYDQKVKLDLSDIANERITLVHVGEKLIILFDNKSTVTVHPFFDSMGVPLQNLSVEVSPGRDLASSEFASTFPISNDQSILPAAGDGTGGTPASGANFSPFSVDDLSSPNPLPLLGPEQLGGIQFGQQEGFVPEGAPIIIAPINGLPTIGVNGAALLDDDALANGNPGGIGDDPDSLDATGVLAHDFGTDGAGTTLLTAAGTILPADFSASINADGTVLTIHQISTNLDVLQISLSNTTDGAYTVKQLNPIIHPPGGDENNLEFAINYIVTDGNGDSVTGLFTVNVDDDVPEAVADTTTTAEDTAVTYNVITNLNGTSDQQGADAPATLIAATLAVPANGTVGFLPNGDITFTPANGFEGAAVINYTIRDADGDEDTATLTVTVAADSTPVVQAANDATVDEDGFAFANADEVPLAANETDSTESLTDTKTIVIDYGNVADVPTTLDGSLVLLDTAGLDGQLQTLDGQNVTFALVGADLVGTVDGGATEVIRIEILTGATALGTDVTYEYKVTLSQPVKHVDDESENSELLTGVTFQATDDEGDIITGTVDVTIVDDVPEAVADTTTTAEDTAVTYNVITNLNGTSDQQGADAPATLIAATLAVPANGTVGFLPNGDITFTPANGFEGAAVINYTIRDADGDEDTATLTVTVAADSTPVVQAANDATVDEDGFAFANADEVPLAANETDSTESLTDTKTIVIDYGNVADVPTTLDGSLVLLDTAGLDGQLQTLDGQNVTFALVGADLVGTVDGGATEVIRIEILTGATALGTDVTYEYKVTLSQPVKHVDDESENSELLTGVTFQATDDEGDIITGTVDVTIVDDVPEAVADTTTTAEDTAVTYNVITNLNGTSDQQGADAPATLIAATLAVPANGTVGFLPNGDITFTPANGFEGAAVINYTIRDADGDEDTATLTVTVAADSTPVVQAANDATVDEDGFAFANADEVPLAANETDSTESLTDTKTIVIDYGNVADVPTTLDGSLVLLDTAGLDGQLQTLDGQNVTFALVGADLVGTVDGGATEVIRIEILTGATALGTDVTYEYKVTLSQPVKHVDDESENSELLTGVTFQATDDEGDIITGTVDVTIVDDVPEAVADTTTTAEDTAVTYNVITNLNGTSDQQGADAPATLIAATLAVPANGTVGFLPNGDITFTPANGFEGAAVINYTIRDADGDEDTATLTVTVAADSTPVVQAANDATVDEDGFAFANADEVPLAANETDSTESLTDTKTIVIDYGNVADVPTTLDGSLVLLDTAGLDGQLQTLDGQNVTFALVGADLVGTVDGGATEVIRIEILTGATALGTDVTYEYKVTLSQPVKHVDDESENSELLTGVTFQATDDEGDIITGTVDVTIVDDVPEAVADTTTTAEDTAVTYNVITNLNGTSDQQGADAPATLIAATLAVPANGTVGFLPNGDITFTPANGFEGAAVINYTIRDADGDEDTATLTVTVAADSTPVVQAANDATVDEDGFAFANADEVPLAANETDSTESLTDTKTIVIDYGNVADVPTTLDGSLVLLDTAGLDGQLQTLDGQNVTFALVGADLVGTVDGGATEVIRIEILTGATALGTDVTYEYKVTLSQPVKHVDDESENSELLTGVTFQATDDEGDIITGTVDVTIVDDVPEAVAPDHAVVTNAAGAAVSFELDQDSTLANNYGADNPGTARFPDSLESTPSGLTSNGVPITYDVSPDGLTLTALAGMTTVFVMVLDPTNGTYTIDMDAPVDSTTDVVFASGGAFNFVGGNDEWAGFIGVGETVAAPIDNNSPDLLLTPEVNGVHDGAIQTTANEGGVLGGGDGNNVGTGETFRVDFVTDLRGDPGSTGGGDYDTLSKRDHVFDGHYTVNGSTATFTSTTGCTIKIAAFDDPDGNNVVGDDPTPDPLTGVVISFNGSTLFIDLTQPLLPSYTIGGQVYTITENPDGSINVGGVVSNTQIGVFTADGYNSIEYSYVSGDAFQIGQFGAAVPTVAPVSFNVPIEIVDVDGDATAGTIGVTLTQVGEGIQNFSISPVGVTATATVSDPHIIGSDQDDTLTGNALQNVLSGNAGNDMLNGAAGSDTLIGGAGADQFRLKSNGGNDTIIDYTDNTDKIGVLDNGSTGSGSVNFVNTVGSPTGTTLAAGDFQIRTGIANINAADDTKVVLINAAQTNAQITTDVGASGSLNSYAIVFNSTTGRGEIWFDTDWGNTANRVQVATLDNITSLAALTAITNTDIVVYTSVVDPIILDLGAVGLTFAAIDDGVMFDINADGHADQVGWTTGEDGFLALDVDGNGTIDNGTEIFTPKFAGGKFESALAALASLDSNHDGKITATDVRFNELQVWQDVNHDGVSQPTELKNLATLGITEIDLAATLSNQEINGQTLRREGTFTYADGTTGGFAEVDLEVALGVKPDSVPQTPTTLDFDPGATIDAPLNQFASDTSSIGGSSAINSDIRVGDTGTQAVDPGIFQHDGNAAGNQVLLANSLDGKITAADVGFNEFQVWQDVKLDGLSQPTELKNLATLGITEIDLAATPSNQEINGQTLRNEGTFTYPNGTTGGFAEVNLEAALANGPLPDSGPNSSTDEIDTVLSCGTDCYVLDIVKPGSATQTLTALDFDAGATIDTLLNQFASAMGSIGGSSAINSDIRVGNTGAQAVAYNNPGMFQHDGAAAGNQILLAMIENGSHLEAADLHRT